MSPHHRTEVGTTPQRRRSTSSVFPSTTTLTPPSDGCTSVSSSFAPWARRRHNKCGRRPFYLEGATSQWYFRLEKNQGEPSWEQFIDGINKRFGPPTRSNPLGELMHLRCSGSIDDYQERFLTLLACCEGVNEKQPTAIFSAGLPPQMGIDVDLQKPTTLDDAMSLAQVFERRLKLGNDLYRSMARISRTSSRTPFSSTPAPNGLDADNTRRARQTAAMEPLPASRLRRWRSSAWTTSASIAQRSSLGRTPNNVQ